MLSTFIIAQPSAADTWQQNLKRGAEGSAQI